MNHFSKKLSVLGFAAIVSVFASWADSAQAASTTCSITRVSWASDDAMGVYCGNTWYFAFKSRANCSSTTDSRKSWASMAQAALLSGKQVILNHESCSSSDATKVFNFMQLGT